MIEALRGIISDKASYLDYGYFGVLGADFDENGVSTGDYTPKPSYYALRTLASVFSEDFETADVAFAMAPQTSKRIAGTDCTDKTIMTYGFKKPNGSYAIAYWNAVPLLTHTYEGTMSILELRATPDTPIRLIDMSNGNVYDLPDSMKEYYSEGGLLLKNIPLTDTPMLLTFGDFADME